MPSIECKCEVGRFTCGHCLQNAKPYLFTPVKFSSMYSDWQFETRNGYTKLDYQSWTIAKGY